MKKLVDNANKVFDDIASGHDKDLEDVFGKANVATARTKYAAGKKWMNDLFSTDHVLTDRSGYSKEVSLGGLTGFHRQIALMPGAIDKPDDPGSIVTMIHEACHAGNADVKDKGYINQPSFTELPEDVKLKNAAHFEVVPRRILKRSRRRTRTTLTARPRMRRLANTRFSACLLTVLTDGVPRGSWFMSLIDVADAIIARLRATTDSRSPLPEVHSPRQSHGDVARVGLFPNPAFTPPPAPPPQQAPQPQQASRTLPPAVINGD